MRGSIHCHGLAKLGNDPGLCDLSQVALKGHIAQEKLLNELDLDHIDDLNRLVEEGKLAEDEICNYVDSIVSAENPNPPQQGEWMKPDIHPCKKKFKNLTDAELDDDYADLVNLVQRHTVCNSAYCLRKNKDGSQTCRFKFPVDECKSTHIEYEKIHSRNSDFCIRPQVVLKRNDTRVNKHQRFQLQAWRANVDIQPIIDYTACLEYIAKYASKSEKISNVAKEAFTSVVKNLKGTEDIKMVIRKLMIKSAGERDFSAQEVMHHIMSLKLVSSSFDVVNLSLEGSRKLSIKRTHVDSEPSILDSYAVRNTLSGINNEILECNLITFFAKYIIIENEIREREKEVIVRVFPNYSSDPKGIEYPLFCKYQLIKYKPWIVQISNAWDDEQSSDAVFCEKWNSFLQSESGQILVPNWRRHLSNIQNFFTIENVEINDELDVEGHREEWMYIAELNNSSTVETSDINVDREYWHQCLQKYSEEDIEKITLDTQGNNYC